MLFFFRRAWVDTHDPAREAEIERYLEARRKRLEQEQKQEEPLIFEEPPAEAAAEPSTSEAILEDIGRITDLLAQLKQIEHEAAKRRALELEIQKAARIAAYQQQADDDALLLLLIQ